MIQQINLYQPSGEDGKHPLSNAYVLLMLASILTLITISALSINKLHGNQELKNQLQMQEQQAQTNLKQLQAQHPDQKTESLLIQELQQLQSRYQNLSQILELLADAHSDRSLGFSRYLLALADQGDSNIWLTEVHIDSESDSISLKGGTFKAEQIPLLLQRLQNTSVFKGRHFAKLNILQSPKTPEQIDFTVSSSLKPDTEENNVRKH